MPGTGAGRTRHRPRRLGAARVEGDVDDRRFDGVARRMVTAILRRVAGS
ncbi:MAG: hypothetical protein AVDCRST_MAG59-2078 [uncultured Thermomicrobiales bacterium]|uniref:Uncharacterized protein n=1 Tax=uncultured Thermomicrobiales bacterium TaxID=1645740 RepID=A0A6J4UMT9_9BACT|nr:MAG: hypothetical protein AVDCRST_MAG59-2078 [uncultured Thermomicrobiales bacterium]